MSTSDDGGPAFPGMVYNGQSGYTPRGGISLRDYFAAAALTGMLANPVHKLQFLPEDDARYCLSIADAMLAARKGGAK